MTKHKNMFSQSNTVKIILVALIGLILLMALLMRGHDIALLNPKGLIAQRQSHLMMFTAAVLLAIAIPTLILFYFFAWKYRQSNSKATYDATIKHGKFFAVSLWIIPSVVVFVLTFNMWPASHELDPHQLIASGTKPLNIQVIALRWKWLFIYPEQNVATVNFVQVPLNVPVQFDLTADEAPMNSFWIPHWGGQLYAMTGHDNRLNLMAETLGDYNGGAAEINGVGFAGMKFTARASSIEDFGQWVQGLKQSVNVLDFHEYQKLLVPSENNQARYYAAAETDLFDGVLTKYGGSHTHQAGYP